jgi:holo-[acyl-carrier protein] synthase
MIKGVGIDVVDVARIGSLYRRYGARFLSRIFTEEEIAYCCAQKHADQHIAGRFAAKEAVFKALGMGLFSGVPLTDVAIGRSASGQPRVALDGRAGRDASAAGVRAVHISISHTVDTAVALAVAEGDDA